MKKTKYTPGDYKLLVKRSLAGLGIFAGEDIPKGACLMEYFGRTLEPKEEYTINSKYLFEINSKKTIDGSIRENKARYFNHSCRPNAEADIVKGHVYIMSLRKIKKGEEVLYDYGKEYWNEYIKPHGCRCPKCSEKTTKPTTKSKAKAKATKK
ncbi:MAG: SET domain-containing protein [Candidatus Paceibacterota bacterium]|jgi:hypothetical protein